jgi:hypothetical protein
VRLSWYPAARGLVPARTGEANAAVMGSHVLCSRHRFVFVQHRGGYVCLSCLRFAKEAGLKRQSLSECTAAYGRDGPVFVAGGPTLGHLPMVAFGVVGRAPVVLCRTCGCCTEAKCVGLSKGCPDRISQDGPMYRSERFLSGLHPRLDLTLGGPLPCLTRGQAFDEDLAGSALLLDLPA